MHIHKLKNKLQLIFFIALFSCSSFNNQIVMATFFGEVKTGLQNVASDRYGYSLFVPSDYTPDRSWPLVMALHDTGERGENYIKVWTEAAKQHGAIIFCPTYEEPKGGLPFDHDNRLIRLKREIQNQYEIDSNRILTTGFGAGGHYAFYLGLRYPNEFTAIASVGNATRGSLKKLFTFFYAEVNQSPILLLVGNESEIADSPESLAELDRLHSKGYKIETVETKASENLKDSSTNFHILKWFEQVSSERASGLSKRPFSVKQEFYEWVDSLFQNR